MWYPEWPNLPTMHALGLTLPFGAGHYCHCPGTVQAPVPTPMPMPVQAPLLDLSSLSAQYQLGVSAFQGRRDRDYYQESHRRRNWYHDGGDHRRRGEDHDEGNYRRRDEEYNEGCHRGRDEEKNEGNNWSRDEGYDEGRHRRRDEGYDEGRHHRRNEGYDEGCHRRRDEDYDEGRRRRRRRGRRYDEERLQRYDGVYNEEGFRLPDRGYDGEFYCSTSKPRHHEKDGGQERQLDQEEELPNQQKKHADWQENLPPIIHFGLEQIDVISLDSQEQEIANSKQILQNEDLFQVPSAVKLKSNEAQVNEALPQLEIHLDEQKIDRANQPDNLFENEKEIEDEFIYVPKEDLSGKASATFQEKLKPRRRAADAKKRTDIPWKESKGSKEPQESVEPAAKKRVLLSKKIKNANEQKKDKVTAKKGCPLGIKDTGPSKLEAVQSLKKAQEKLK